MNISRRFYFRKVSSVSSNSAFHFVTQNDEQSETPRNIRLQKVSSSTSNNSSLKDVRKRLESSDNENDSETEHLNANELRLRLKEQKRYRRKTGELLNKLHDNYEELLEKYAHAENTIDQLRFQSKQTNENTPRSTTSEVGYFSFEICSSHFFVISIIYILLNNQQ